MVQDKKIKHLGKRLLKARWKLLNSRWIEIERLEAKYVLEMLAEILNKHGVPAEVRILGTSLPALAVDALAPGAAGTFGKIYALRVPEAVKNKARKIIKTLLYDRQ